MGRALDGTWGMPTSSHPSETSFVATCPATRLSTVDIQSGEKERNLWGTIKLALTLSRASLHASAPYCGVVIASCGVYHTLKGQDSAAGRSGATREVARGRGNLGDEVS